MEWKRLKMGGQRWGARFAPDALRILFKFAVKKSTANGHWLINGEAEAKRKRIQRYL